MSDRAAEIAGLLLREGALRRDDPEHREIYGDLMGDAPLFEEIRGRLAAVGFELVQELGHLGVRVASAVLSTATLRNRMGIHAGHVRLMVYLWVQLVYREWVNLRRGLRSKPPGAEQETLFAEEDDDALDEPAWIPYQKVFGEFADHMPRTHIKSYLRALQRWRFIRFDERRDRVWADASLYVLIDRNRMEEFVVGLARRLGTEEPAAAVADVALGRVRAGGEGAET